MYYKNRNMKHEKLKCFLFDSTIFRLVQLILIFTDCAQNNHLNVIFNHLLGFSSISRLFFTPIFCVPCLSIHCVHMPDNYSFLNFIILKSEHWINRIYKQFPLSLCCDLIVMMSKHRIISILHNG